MLVCFLYFQTIQTVVYTIISAQNTCKYIYIYIYKPPRTQHTTTWQHQHQTFAPLCLSCLAVLAVLVDAISVLQAKLQRLRQQQQPPGSPPAPARWTLHSVAENGSANNGVQERKFRTNKDKLQAQDACPSGGSAINVIRSSSKLKPVKERRPTALPTEVPSIEIEDVRDAKDTGDSKDSLGERVALQPGANAHVDVVDGGGKSKLKVNVNGIIDESVAHDDDYDDTPSSTSIATTPVTEGPVKFFIGHTQELSAQQTDDTLSCQSSDANNNSAAKLTNGVLPQEQTEREMGKQQALQAPPRAKSSSNVSLNYLAKSQTDSQRRRRVSTMPDINIPPAPPLPPELLVPGTPLHLRKKRSMERQQQQEQQEQQQQQQQEIQQDATNSQVSNEVACQMTSPANWPELCGYSGIEVPHL